MAKPTLNDFVTARIAAGHLSEDDVINVRRYVYGDMAVSLEEGEALFRLNNANISYHDTWFELFPEAILDILVHQAKPEGYVSEDKATWLIDQILADGHICGKTELDAVLHVLEKARDVPEKLEQFALRAVADSVIAGEGPTRSGTHLKPGVIADAEVELLRRVLYASSGSRGVAISKAEAEVLFDLNDATVEAENAPAWSELFAKAVANFVMAMSGFTPPPRKIALERENWLEQPGGFDGGLGGFFKKMFSGGVGGIRDAYGDKPDPFAARGNELLAEIAANEVVTEEEAAWLVNRIGRDGILHENEKALLRFIREESPNIHPALMPLLEKV
ncbi:hypothetical protein SIAM614_17429 [Stappia aggregata IAM 12614]|uniref:Uncharacterized protein n=1 Tax=Roseibium aggregatum (strain ATCC 25650 / DSM 13394 / JCM 20685 / NBRC 16684 / NCIMB 2208 / IAM 12614 / B1) TaxID=384765 RepID=A0P2F2_ROSAI|nr:hypothetical protein [Roseibium aggregatum]EAV40816.1 hypothetical protein SIAM614_17429 [Stappia aggregata IAM 12614] [Roseibium aggregatum IAM 12614]